MAELGLCAPHTSQMVLEIPEYLPQRLQNACMRECGERETHSNLLPYPAIPDMNLQLGFFMDLDFEVSLFQIMSSRYVLAALMSPAYPVF